MEAQQFKSFLRKPWVLAVVGFLALCCVSLVFLNEIMGRVLHSRSEVMVPNLEGRSLTEALSLVSGIKLSLRQEGFEFDESLPAGTILRQNPLSGMKVRQGRAISVVISKGGEAVFVPGVAGKSLPEVQSMLSQEKLQMGAVSELYSMDVPDGLAISQSPSSGTVVAKGAMVDVAVSKGMPPAGAPLVPDFTGKLLDEVQSWAQGVHVQVKVREDPKSVGPANTVIRQDPLPQQPILEGDTLLVVISPAVSSKNGYRFTYTVPTDRKAVVVRMVARDNKGESEIYKGLHVGGETIEIPMAVTNTTRVRIYLDDVLQEEKVLEP